MKWELCENFFFLQELVDDMRYDIDFVYSYTVRMPLTMNNVEIKRMPKVSERSLCYPMLIII